MNQHKYFIRLLSFALLVSSCSYNSLKLEGTDIPSSHSIQTVVFAIVVSVDRVILFKAEEMDAVPSQKPAIELLLDLDSGKTISIIQKEGDHSFNKGQRVKVLKSKGKSRVMPLK